MKESKIYSLLFFSLLLLLIASLVLLYTWGYYKFYSNNEKIVTTKQVLNNSERNYQDSLEIIYNSTLKNFYTNFNAPKSNDTTSTKTSEVNQDEFHKLKNEIEEILNNNPLKADLDVARQKITELQLKLIDLNNKNINAQIENKKLNNTLARLATNIKSVEEKIKSDKIEDNRVISPNKPETLFKLSDLQVSAIMDTDDTKKETTLADKTDQISGTLNVSNSAIVNNAEIFVVVLRPDGRVLQGSSWETGTFESREGRKIYSTKLSFEYFRIENKRLGFSISGNDYKKGVYTIQFYNNGSIIGKTTKTLY